MKDVGAGYIAEGMKTEGNQYLILLAIQLPSGTYVYLCNDPGVGVTALSQDDTTSVFYARYPLSISSDADVNTNNEFPKISITLATTPTSIVSSYVRDNDGLRGCPMYVIRTFKNLIGTPQEATYREKARFIIDSTNLSDNNISFSLVTGIEFYGSSIPRRRYYKNFCSRKYLNVSDGEMEDYWADFYCNKPNGTSTGCKRTYADCEERSLLMYFGGFPDIPRTRVPVAL